jgi:hypothetical protein
VVVVGALVVVVVTEVVVVACVVVVMASEESVAVPHAGTINTATNTTAPRRPCGRTGRMMSLLVS